MQTLLRLRLPAISGRATVSKSIHITSQTSSKAASKSSTAEPAQLT